MNEGKSNTDSQTIRIAVVGGGLAGIAAAVALRRVGFEVTIFEGKRMLGGRAGSFHDSASDEFVDYCQHVGMGCCTNLLQLMKELDLEDYWQRERTLHFYSARGQHIPITASFLPAPLHLSQLVQRWPELTWDDRRRIGAGLWRLMREPFSVGEQCLPADAWLREHGQSTSTIDKFWSTILVSALGDQLQRLTIGPMRKVLIDGFAANRDAYHLLVPKLPFGDLIGRLVAERLQKLGIEIRCSTPIERLERIGADFRLISTSFSNGDDPRALEFAAVILAVPWYRSADLVRDLVGDTDTGQKFLNATMAFESAPISGVHMWWDRDWLKTPHAILINRLSQWVFARMKQDTQPPKARDEYQIPFSNAVSKSPSALPDVGSEANQHYYQVVISGSRDLPRGSPASVVEMVRRDLADVFPEARAANLIRAKLVTDPLSVFSLPIGQTIARPHASMLSERGVWLAGDWTETGWPATMEGAIRSGNLAAESVAARFGKEATFIADDLPRGRLARTIIRNAKASMLDR